MTPNKIRNIISVTLVATVAAVALVAASPSTGQASISKMAATSYTVMPIGDSITVGCCSPCPDGYRWYLGDRLVLVGGVWANYIGPSMSGCSPNPRYAGGNGYTINQVRTSIAGWFATGAPDIALLDIGVNDARNGRTATQMLADMGTLLDTMLTYPNTRVVVAKLIVPNGAVNANLRAAGIPAQQFNDGLQAVADARAPRVIVADMSIIPTSSLGDGLHPNDIGYRQMSWIWYMTLAQWVGTNGYLAWSEVPFPVVPKLN